MRIVTRMLDLKFEGGFVRHRERKRNVEYQLIVSNWDCSPECSKENVSSDKPNHSMSD